MNVQPLYHDTKTSKIYVKLFNELHWIVDPPTLSAVFGPSEKLQIQDSVPSLIAEGFRINAGSCLIASGGTMYLCTDRKRFSIASPDALNGYQFHGAPYPRNGQDDILANIIVDSVPDGGSIG